MLTRLRAPSLRLDYDQLNYRGWWDGAVSLPLPPGLAYSYRCPMFKTYARVIGIADWDRDQAVRTYYLRRPL